MKKIVFIDPEGIRRGLNIGLAYLASSLEKEGHKVEVLDFNNEYHHQGERLKLVRGSAIVGFSIKTFTIKESLKLAGRVKELNPGAFLICGGPHLSIDGLNFMKENKIFNAGVAGEGEKTIVELAQGRPLKEIEGIIYNQDGETISTRPRPYTAHLDTLPFPDYNLFDKTFHKGRPYPFPRQAYPLLTSRGCPFNCIYCASYLSMGRVWRPRTVANVIEELRQATTRYDICEFEIHDDNFNVDIERAKEFCRKVKLLKLPWSWPSGLKANFVDSELVRLMKESGCYYVYVGIETGEEKVYAHLNKGGSLYHIKEAVRMLKSAGIKVAGAFIIGLPHSTKAIDEKSLRFARGLKLDLATWELLHPYYGTPLYHLLETDTGVKKLYPWNDVISFGPEAKASFETDSYSAAERLKMYYRANLRSRAYVAFIKQNGNPWEKAWGVLIAICRYDPLNLFYHLFRVSVIAIKSRARNLNLA